MRRFASIALVALAFAACAASLPIERREYILSRPHGWIELEVEDSAIPPVPVSDEDPALVRPADCSLTVKIDEEPFVGGAVYPDGEQAPFHVRSGFRFPVPVGTIDVHVAYFGCDGADEDGVLGSVGVAVPVTVAESMVTDLAFDGSALTAGAPRADGAVTLERIYDAVRGGR